MRNTSGKVTFLTLFLFFSVYGFGQNSKADSTNQYKIISAGPEYGGSPFFQWLWGRNYRKEWTTPIKVPIVSLDTLKGGIKPYKAGGGNQTKSLHSKTKEDKEYTFRSVNKSLGKVLPKDLLNTFIEDLVNDKVSMQHPYSAGSIPIMAESAKVYHTNPQYVYLPKQPALDTFNEKFGNTLFLFEQRLDGSWKDAPNLGGFDKYSGTDKVLEKMYESNRHSVDQRQFIRSRIFDWFINDWDRHEDQWKWGTNDTGSSQFYVPVPQDRDQAYFKYNGVLLKLLIGASGLSYFQAFSEDLPDIKAFNYEERNLDRFFTNQMTLDDWQSIARELQAALKDDVIEASVKQLPAEIYAVSGREIISKLKSRRGHLEEYATDYYKFIAQQVDIIGSEEQERFAINRGNNETSVNIFRISKDAGTDSKAFYSRTFKNDETNEIRVYGLSGEDVYTVTGDESNGIRIRIIGGDSKDSIINLSKGEKIHVYDNDNNVFQKGSNTRLHLSKDSSIHEFKYASYLYDKKGIKPSVFFDDDDRVFVGIGYGSTHHKWRKEPFAYKQSLAARYSISQGAFRFLYDGLFPKAIGKWDFLLKGDYDFIKWLNFYGLGNETRFTTKDLDFFRMQKEEWIANAGISRKWGRNNFRIISFLQSIRLINNEDRYIAKEFRAGNRVDYKTNLFTGGQLGYSAHKVNDSIVPTRGFAFWANAIYTHNLQDNSKSFTRYTADWFLYIPLISKFSLAIRVGGKTITGTPEFYQYAFVGGGQTIRGFRRERFWGKTSFYNSNELRYISKVNSYIFNGRAGLVAFVDNGRVWMPSEKSDKLHVGYGGGIFLAPFNKASADITYGVSKEISLVQLRVTQPF